MINMFENGDVNLNILKKRAHNLRWASVPDGVIPLTAADPDFPCAPEISEAIAAFSKDRYFSYGPADGLPEFKESLAQYFKVKRQVPVSPALVLPVDSAAYGIYMVCKAFLNPGDEAIIFDPVDFLFRYSVESMHAKAVPFGIAPGTKHVDFTHLENLINPKTKLICLCNPLNPTGKVFSRDELTTLGEIACKHNLLILSDEIWSDIIFAPNVFTSIASIDEAIRRQTVTVTGFSKSYGLAGLRIGAVVAHTDSHYQKLFEASMHQSTIHGANVISQVAATTALQSCAYWLDGFLNHLQHMRDVTAKNLLDIPQFSCVLPQGCYVAFINIAQSGQNSQQMHQKLLDHAKVAVVPGLKQWFGDGAENHIRISFATSHHILQEAFDRIKSTLA